MELLFYFPHILWLVCWSASLSSVKTSGKLGSKPFFNLFSFEFLLYSMIPLGLAVFPDLSKSN